MIIELVHLLKGTKLLGINLESLKSIGQNQTCLIQQQKSRTDGQTYPNYRKASQLTRTTNVYRTQLYQTTI